MDVIVQEQPLPFFNMFGEEEEDKQAPNWPVIRDLFSQEIRPARDWKDAQIIGTLDDMCGHFSAAFPGVLYSVDDMKMALHDMNIPFERNEHNNKYYYLAMWR